MIENHLLSKEVDVVDAIKGRFDDVIIEMHCMNEPNYTMMLISLYDTLELMDKEITKKITKIL